jgi:hypothetical protein
MQATKQLTVRMPRDLAKKIEDQGAAAPFIIDAVREKLERQREAEIETSLACLANDPEANDISDWAPFQAKVIERVD